MTSFVTRSGTQLLLDGVPFRFAGMNIFWLGAFDNPPAWPTHFEIDDGLNTAKEMGANVIRSHDMGNSEGNPTSLTVLPSTAGTVANVAALYAQAGLISGGWS